MQAFASIQLPGKAAEERVRLLPAGEGSQRRFWRQTNMQFGFTSLHNSDTTKKIIMNGMITMRHNHATERSRIALGEAMVY